MKKVLENYGGVLLFYLTIILCIFFINARFNYLNKDNVTNSSIYALKE